MRWPGGIQQPGRTWNGVVGQIDLLATLAEILGVALPDPVGEDSQSFASVLFDPSSGHERLPLINHSAAGGYAVTEGTWKLVLPKGRNPAELYNLAVDPGEDNNIIARYPERTQALQDKATDIVLNGRTTPGAMQANDTGYWQDLKWITEEQYNARQAESTHGR